MGIAWRSGIAAAMVAAMLGTAPATAQDGLPATVMISTIKVAPAHHDEFRQWIADFREAVEKLIAEDRLSQTDLCAYRSWRVLGPDAAGLNEDFIFIFEPVIPIANYRLQHYLELAFGPAGAFERMARYHTMAPGDPGMLFAAPLNPEVDAIDLGAVCEF